MYIVYVTTNLITHQMYFGVHEQENPYEFDGYLGSGQWSNEKSKKHMLNRIPGKQSLREAINQYGRDNFTRETLFYYYYQGEAWKKESEIVTWNLVNQDICYNLVPGGRSGTSLQGKKQSLETIEKRVSKFRGKPRVDMIGGNNYFHQKPRSTEQCKLAQLISAEKQKGKPKSEKAKKVYSEARKALFASGYIHPMTGRKMSKDNIEKNKTRRLGKKASEETKRKMSLSHKGRTNSFLKGKSWRMNQETNKREWIV